MGCLTRPFPNAGRKGASMSTSSRETLAGLHVLLVEDEYLVARLLGDQLRELGCVVVGPASTSEAAVALLKSERVDAAILDINLIQATSEPVARELRYRRCPFLFVTGYSEIGVLPNDLRGCCILAKPVDQDTLANALLQLNVAPQA